MRIECAYNALVNLDELKPHPSNRNKHSPEQIKVLAKLIAKNGQRSPLVVSNQSTFITKGNGRYEAIKLLGWEKCAVDYQNYASELEELSDRIADNEIAKYSEFDELGFLDDLKEFNNDLSEIDFEEFGKINFKLPLMNYLEEDSKEDSEKEADPNKKFILQVNLPNELELRDLYDDLVSKGYIVREI